MPASALERQSRLLQELYPPANMFTHVTTTFSMSAADHHVKFAAGGTYTITLPPVMLAAGQFYLLRLFQELLL